MPLNMQVEVPIPVHTDERWLGYVLRVFQGNVMRLIQKSYILLEELAMVKMWLGKETAGAIHQWVIEQQSSLADDLDCVAR